MFLQGDALPNRILPDEYAKTGDLGSISLNELPAKDMNEDDSS
jgi:hypothetical protein